MPLDILDPKNMPARRTDKNLFSLMREDYNKSKREKAMRAAFSAWMAKKAMETLLPEDSDTTKVLGFWEELVSAQTYSEAKTLIQKIGKIVDHKVLDLESSPVKQEFFNERRREPSLVKRYRDLTGPIGYLVMDILHERELDLRFEDVVYAYTVPELARAALKKLPHESDGVSKDRGNDIGALMEMTQTVRVYRLSEHS
ncbi:MAG: hypothetical protein ABJC67_07940, partial [Lentilitoribacter sp.]